MIARAILLFLLAFIGFFALMWVVFRTNFLTRQRVGEIVKTGSILTASVVSAATVVAILLAAEKLI